MQSVSCTEGYYYLENAKQDFLDGKKELDSFICWKNLYEEEIREKKALGWFLLLAESLNEAEG